MIPLRLGYASFVYFVYKNGYEVQCHAKNRITFWHDEKSKNEYDSYQVRDKGDDDCGYVVIDPEALDERFKGEDKEGEDKEERVKRIVTLKTGCTRIKQITKNKITGVDEIRVSHCHEPGHKTTIRNGEIVECKCS